MKQKITQTLFSRNTLLFLIGLGGVIHETVWTSAERPTLLILFAAMMGLPAFLETKKDKDDKKGEDEDLQRWVREQMERDHQSVSESKQDGAK